MNSLSWKSLIPLVIKKSLQIWSHMVGTNWYFPVLVQSRISTQTIVVLSVSLELNFLNHFHFFDNFWQLSIKLYFLFSFRPLSFPLALSHTISLVWLIQPVPSVNTSIHIGIKPIQLLWVSAPDWDLLSQS